MNNLAGEAFGVFGRLATTHPSSGGLSSSPDDPHSFSNAMGRIEFEKEHWQTKEMLLPFQRREAWRAEGEMNNLLPSDEVMAMVRQRRERSPSP